jgi:hypothetical protein
MANIEIDNEFLGRMRKGLVSIKGPYTDMQMTQGMANFSSAVGSAYKASGSASGLKTTSSTQPRNKTTNYYLTAAEKKLIAQRSTEFSKPGIVPYDVLEDFLYVLCYVDDYETMKMVSTVTGVVGLDSSAIIREPLLILNIPDLGKIGYLANGLAALTKQLDSERFPQTTSTSQPASSSYSGIAQMIASGNPMSAFPGLGNIVSLFGQVTSLVGTVEGLISTFSTKGTVQTKISSITNVASQITSVINTATSTLSMGGKNNIVGSFPILNQLSDLSASLDLATRSLGNLQQVQSSNSYPESKIDDINASLKGYFDQLTSISSSLTQLLSSLSGVLPPQTQNIALAAETLTKNLSGGAVPSSFMVGKILGQEIPQNILAKNPMSQPPSKIAQTFFGASLATTMHYRDGGQFPAVPIGIFMTAASGAATSAFSMQNSSAMGGAMSLQSAVSTILGNVPSSVAEMHVSNVSNLLGATATAVTELRRSDNAIPIMIGLATSFSNDTSCPFPTSVFSEGWKIASAAGNMLQKEGKTITV